MMLLVLGTSSSYEVVQGLHLRGHVLHLFVDDADCLIVYGLGGVLNRSITLIYSLEVSRLAQLVLRAKIDARTVQSVFILPLRVSLDLRTSSTTQASFFDQRSILSL